MGYRDDLEAAHARIEALEYELAQLRAAPRSSSPETARLVAELEAARRDAAELVPALEAAHRETARLRDELARARAESADYVERIRFLQDERAKLQQASRSSAAAQRPAILARGARPVCPHCEKTGRAVTLLRDAELTPAACPQCATITLLRG